MSPMLHDFADRAVRPLFIEARHLFAPIAIAPREIAVFAYLDPNWRLLGSRHVPAADDADAVAIPLRTIVCDALKFDAAAVAMAHNHPSGDPTPSAADHALTRRLASALDAIGVRLIEHLVLAESGSESFRQQGWL